MNRAFRFALSFAFGASLVAIAGCKDVSRFSSGDDHYEGAIVQGDFVRAGFDGAVNACLVLDASHLQDAPGRISTSDGLLSAAPLRPIPQIWHDPLSTFDFGEGRVQNLLYVASPTSEAGAADVMVVVSLMQGGNVEARVLRGAPSTSAPSNIGAAPLFGVFSLARAEGPCAY